ncbi:MAG: family 4 glycosyl hydrolase [Planctomycetota bacterium]
MLRRFDDRRRKVACIGASYKFVHQAVRDMIISKQFEDTDVWLYDIDPAALNLEHDAIARMARQGRSAITVHKAASRAEALDGADYVIVSVLVGGMDAAEAEDRVCQQYGIRHTVGDTIGPMCTARCLRMVPLMLSIAADMERYCPSAPMLSVTNPMAVLTSAVNRYSKIDCIGICHGTGGQVGQIARAYGVDRPDVCVDVVGVNHLGFITRIEIAGRHVPMDEVVEKMREVLRIGYLDEATGKTDQSNQAFEFFRMTGLLPNNGDHHFIEFFPWFLAKHAFVDGENVYGLDGRLHDPDERRRRKQQLYEMVSGWAHAPEDQPVPDMDRYSAENIIDIIAGLEHRGFITTSELHLNMTNGGAVPNLPPQANLELTCHVTPRGMQPIQYEPLEPFPLGVLTPLVCVNELALTAAVEKDRKAFLEALLLDPLLQEFHTVEELAERLWAINEEWWTPVV